MIPVEVSVAIIGALSVFVSAGVSYFIARMSFKNELKKLHEIWEHEKALSLDNEFGNMSASVAFYLKTPKAVNLKSALEAINIVRVKADGEIGSCLDDLSYKVAHSFEQPYFDEKAIQDLLKEIVKKYRQARGQYGSGQH